MTKTREELVDRALKKLKVIGAGQAASAPVTQSVDDMVEPVMQDLARRGIFGWGNEDELPDDAFEHLAKCLACAAAGDFGKSAIDDLPIEQSRMLAEARLRELNRYSLSGQPQPAEYY